MWNCDWEYENQETLKQWYEEKNLRRETGLCCEKNHL